MLDSKDTFHVHLKETRRFDDPLEAERFTDLCCKVAEILAKHFPVYVRRAPEFHPDNEFNSTEPSWEATARYSIADTGEPGLYFFYADKWERQGEPI